MMRHIWLAPHIQHNRHMSCVDSYIVLAPHMLMCRIRIDTISHTGLNSNRYRGFGGAYPGLESRSRARDRLPEAIDCPMLPCNLLRSRRMRAHAIYCVAALYALVHVLFHEVSAMIRVRVMPRYRRLRLAYTSCLS